MEFCVLGLLLTQNMTIYDIHKAFQQSLSLFYSASLGSLKRAVDQLLKGEFIACREVIQGKRKKKLYNIVPKGQLKFFQEMQDPIPAAKLETVALSRLSFLGLLDPEQKKETLAIIVSSTERSLQSLLELESTLEGLAIPDSYGGIFFWQKKTLEYGIMSHRAGLGWFNKLLGDVLEKGPSPD